MDSDLIDTSKYRIYNLSLDSRFADTYYNATADWLIRLASPYKNIMRVALSSIEIPNVAWVFSAANGNLDFTYQISCCPPVRVCIQPGNYDASGLVNAVQMALRATGEQFCVALNEITGQIAISHEACVPFRLFFDSCNSAVASRSRYWGLGFWLGFRCRCIDVTPGAVAVGSSVILTQAAPYYIVQMLITGGSNERLDNITHMTGNGDSVAAFAKVILRNGSYVMEFDDNANLLRKEFTFLAPVNVAQLRFRVLDPWGNLIDLLDADWSCSVELYEVVNSRTYRALAQGYERNLK